jgi:hypothetical protein
MSASIAGVTPSPAAIGLMPGALNVRDEEAQIAALRSLIQLAEAFSPLAITQATSDYSEKLQANLLLFRET